VLVLAVLLAAGAGAAAYLLTRPVKEVVPTVVGEQLAVAQAQIQNANLAVSVIDVTDPKAAGTVIRQDPLGGAKAKQGSTVALVVSQGPGNTTVPPVFGLSERQAQRAIDGAGLSWRVQQETSQTLPGGEAIGTDPASGQPVPVGNRVTLLVSSGKPLVTVPDLNDIAQGTASTDIANAGLTVGTVTTQPSSTIPPGNVVSQSPAPYAQVSPGSTVDLVVATKPAPTPATATVPWTRDDTQATATNVLTGAGFQVAVQARATTRPKQDGLVLSESPHAGASATKGATVTIVVGKYTRPATSTSSSTTTTSTTTTATTSSTTTPAASTTTT
jgi:beta-lactam-binding protein with PASTA domain